MTRIPALCLFLLTATACSSAKVGYDYDPGANFTAYHTYDWVAGEPEKTGDRRADSSDVEIRIRTAIAAQLLQKGYTKPASGQPDFYVTYHIGVNNLTPDTSTQYFSKGMAGHPSVHSVDTRTMGKKQEEVNQPPSYMTGTLMVDVIDAASQKLVWRGTAAGEIDLGLTSRERDERMRTITREMFSHFPPQ